MALDPRRLTGIHLNYIPGSYRPHVGPDDGPLGDAERVFEADRDRWYEEEGAYAHLQATAAAPAFALNDSPAGLLAWIVEKFRDWSDCGGEVERRFSKDQLLDNVTLYWVTGTIHSSMRLYYESKRTPLRLGPGNESACPARLRASRRRRQPAPRVGGPRLRPAALDRDAARRPFRRDGGAGAARGGHPCVLPDGAVTTELRNDRQDEA